MADQFSSDLSIYVRDNYHGGLCRFKNCQKINSNIIYAFASQIQLLAFLYDVSVNSYIDVIHNYPYFMDEQIKEKLLIGLREIYDEEIDEFTLKYPFAVKKSDVQKRIQRNFNEDTKNKSEEA